LDIHNGEVKGTIVKAVKKPYGIGTGAGTAGTSAGFCSAALH